MSLRFITVLLMFLIAIAAVASDAPEGVSIRTDSDRVPLLTVSPDYPAKARRDRIEAEVQVCFDIDRKGRTRRVAVRRSTNRAFERPSIRAVKASTFRALDADQELPGIKSCRTFTYALTSSAGD